MVFFLFIEDALMFIKTVTDFSNFKNLVMELNYFFAFCVHKIMTVGHVL